LLDYFWRTSLTEHQRDEKWLLDTSNFLNSHEVSREITRTTLPSI